MKKIDCVVVGAIETNCWLYALDDEQAGSRPCAVIDPGDEAGLIIARLKELNMVPRYILFTHGHFDHLLALPDLLTAFADGVFDAAPPPETGIHREDAHYLGKDAYSAHRKTTDTAGGDPAYADSFRKNFPGADILFEEGDTVGPFRVLHVPGHTRGCVCYYDEKAGVLFSGDTLFRGDWGRTDLPGGSEEEIRRSLKRLLAMNPDTVVCPGHGPATTIKEEEDLLQSNL